MKMEEWNEKREGMARELGGGEERELERYWFLRGGLGRMRMGGKRFCWGRGERRF